MVDLHIHSTASDGTDSPTRIIEKCSRLNLKLASITDHDTLAGQSEAIKAAKKHGLNYITGVELSVTYNGELHMLGYGIDIHCRKFNEKLMMLRDSREHRAKEMIKRLCEKGMKIDYDEVLGHSDGNIGRPHIAKVLMEKGYVGSFEEAFDKYIGSSGSCYVPRFKLTPKEAIELIIEAGGYPVIAHPKFIDTDDFDGLIKEFMNYGSDGRSLWGIEAYYPNHKSREVARFVTAASDHGLYVTSGSDYHGRMKRVALASEKRTGELLEKSIGVLLEKAI